MTFGPEFRARVIARMEALDPSVKVLDIGFTLGDKPDITEDEVEEQILSSLRQQINGTAKVSESFEDDRPTVNVKEFLEQLK